MDILDLIIGFVSGGGLAVLLTLPAIRKKAQGEAAQTETEAFKSLQDVYQQTVSDLNTYIEDIRADRNHLRKDRDEMRAENEELRQRQNEVDEKVRQLEDMVADNARKVEAMRPFICARLDCPKRVQTLDFNAKKS